MRYPKYLLALSMVMLFSSSEVLNVRAKAEAPLWKGEPALIGEVTGALVDQGCHFHVDDPYNSFQKPGSVNVVAKFKCNTAVLGIKMTVLLARDGQLVSTSTSTDLSGNRLLEWHTDTPCVDGTYEGTAYAAVVFPPSIFPPRFWSVTRTGHANSNQITIHCQ